MRALLLTLCLLSLPTHGEWSAPDTQRQVAFLAVYAMDWRQTQVIARGDHRELNVVLGPDPSIGEVNAYFAATAVLHTLIARRLSPHWRERWQLLTISHSATSVYWNYRMGVRLEW